MNRQIYFILIAATCSLFIPLANASDPSDVPEGAQVEVIQSKITEEAQRQLESREELPVIEVVDELPVKDDEQSTPFFVKKIVMEGDGVALGKDLEILTKSYEERAITFKELKRLMNDIEKIYRAKGFFGVIYAPPQRIEEGVVTLRAVTSEMGELEISETNYFRKSRIQSLWKIPSGKDLRYDELRNNLLELNQNPDRKIRAGLRAGKKPETTNVVLNVEENFPIHLGYSFDNQGVKLTGERRNGFTIRHNNFLSLEDIFLVGTTFGERFGAFFISHIIPITNFGTRLNWGFSHAQVNPKKEFERFGINGISQSYSVKLMQKIIRNEKTFVETNIGLDFKEKSTRILSITSAWDRLRVLKAGLTFQNRDKKGVWMGTQDVSFGIPLHGDGFPLNSRGGETQFFIYKFSLQRNHRLPFGLIGEVKTRGQLTGNRLLPQEQIFFGGATSVRGYPESDFGADQGILTNIEIRSPLYIIPKEWKIPQSEMALRNQINLFSFVDHAYGRLNDITATERKSRNLMGVGGGVSFRFNQYFTAKVAYGFAIGDEAIGESGSKQLHFTLNATV